jgi:hypothetical protein
VVLPEIAPDDAVIVAAPVATAVASPPASTVTKVAASDVQVADAVMFCEVPSE